MNFNHRKPKAGSNVAKSRLIIGRKPLIEALHAGKNIEKIFLLQGASGEEMAEIRDVARKNNIPVSSVPQEKLQRFTASNHQGVIAIAGLVQYFDLQDVIDQINEAGRVPLLALLDGVTDTRNIGAIARSAFCFGADAIILPASNTAPVTEDAIKTSAGALERLSICRAPSVEQALDLLHLNGITTIAASLSGNTKNIKELDLDIPIAMVLGSEDKGVGSYVEKNSTHLVRIPMSGNFDSLNVSVAAGIVFYEVFNQRSK